MNIVGRPRNSATASEGGIAQAGDGPNIVINGADVQVAHVAVEVRATWAAIDERYRQHPLEDRSIELAQFEEFLRGRDTGWWGWAGAAWAGKTRLMAELACCPPVGWRVAAFFARRGTQDNDERGFLRSLLVQLAGVIGDELLVLGVDLPAQRAQLRDLIGLAARACADRGEGLLLLVDGLDEDDVHETESDRSIAALLPGSQAPCVIAVSSRPSPVLRLPPGHALADAANWHPLRAVRASSAARATARTDMRAVLAEPSGLEAAALMAVTGHPLTSRLLASITGRPTDAFEDLFASSRGRCFTPVATQDPRRVAYVLAHASLYDMLVQRLDPDFDQDSAGVDEAGVAQRGHFGPAALSAWRDRVIIWASSWIDRGWPTNTPDYLLHDDFLRIVDDALLVDVLTDRNRHARVAARFGSAAPALGQLRAHLRDLLPAWNGDLDDAPGVDLVRSARLLFALQDLNETSGRLPANLPAIFARIGQRERAEQLAGATSGGPTAFVELARAYLDTGHEQFALGAARRAVKTMPTSSAFQPSTAELYRDLTLLFIRLKDPAAARATADAIPDDDQDHQNTVVAKIISLSMIGDVDRAVATAARLGVGDRRRALQDAALAAHACGASAAAERLAQTALAESDEPGWRLPGSEALIPTLAKIGLLSAGRELAERLTPRARLEASVWLSEWCLHHDDRSQADDLATMSIAAAAETTDHRMVLARTRSRLTTVLIRLNRYDDAAIQLALNEEYLDCPMHAEMSAAYRSAGRADLARAHLELALAVPEENGAWSALHTLDDVIEKLGSGNAENWLPTIVLKIEAAAAESPPGDMSIRRVLERIAGLLAWRGEYEASVQVLGLVRTENEFQQSEVAFHHAMALAAGPAWDHAAESIDRAHTGADHLADLAQVLVEHGHIDAAAPLAAEALAPRLTGVWQASIPADLAYALAANDRLDLANAVASRENPQVRDELLFATGLAAGRRDLAAAQAELARTADSERRLAPTYAALALVTIGIDDDGHPRPVDSTDQAENAGAQQAIDLLDRALDLPTATSDGVSPGWIRESVTLFARLGMADRATQLVRERMHPTERPGMLADVAHILLSSADRAGAGRMAKVALRAITEDLDQSQWLYFSATLVKALSMAPAFRTVAEQAAQLAWTNLPPLVSEPPSSRHGQSQSGRDVSLVIEALLAIGRRGSARGLLADAQRVNLDLDIFGLTPAIAIHDSAAAALKFIDSTSPHNRLQPLERAFDGLLRSEQIGAARLVMETIDDPTVRCEMHLRVAAYYADTGRPTVGREWVRSALEQLEQGGPYRRGQLHAWAAHLLLALGDRHASEIQLRDAIHAFTSEPHSNAHGLVEGLAELASAHGVHPVVQHLIATSWAQAGHPLSHWNLLFATAPDDAAAIAEWRWGSIQT